MISAIRRWTRSGAVHVLFAFLAMGGWAVAANSGHPMPLRLLAGVVQGTTSAVLTLFLKSVIDALAARLRRPVSLWAPPLIACLGSASILVAAHSLNGTPAIPETVAVPLLVSSTYAASYNFSIYRARGR